MLVALEQYHRKCEQHLEQYISIENNNAIQSLGQSRFKEIVEHARTIYNQKNLLRRSIKKATLSEKSKDIRKEHKDKGILR